MPNRIDSPQFNAEPLPLTGAWKIQRKRRHDERGSLTRLYSDSFFASLGWVGSIVQINHSVNTQAGTLRGLHFQLAPYSEFKYVLCLRGNVFDVVVDLRSKSPTFLQHCAIDLEDDQGVLIPPGCAHGFQTRVDGSELIYLHNQPYQPDAERGLHYADPQLQIAWPLPISQISERDQQHPPLASDFKGL
ncbi:dTDP-4-dehydrorhamnose 3,5-epimerase family protein [Parvibium lacunae]|uniref:dTDP-4-dehydrorhamnose 3,5-epimerase n=1 Tax=Parvibium lacunae TaxID=1888893 RepID=A0A368L3W1_9BURK|nr:dTDP-4-dehydrorhamnose 3,5-epimerase family protein [Parvibium lacunae]RCS58215.1 dTDP-4-keto-6-deoxy-D-glucose epimerase [Parvibium lacunae]